jgi:hypothetical protein
MEESNHCVHRQVNEIKGQRMTKHLRQARQEHTNQLANVESFAHPGLHLPTINMRACVKGIRFLANKYFLLAVFVLWLFLEDRLELLWLAIFFLTIFQDRWIKLFKRTLRELHADADARSILQRLRTTDQAERDSCFDILDRGLLSLGLLANASGVKQPDAFTLYQSIERLRHYAQPQRYTKPPKLQLIANDAEAVNIIKDTHRRLQNVASLTTREEIHSLRHFFRASSKTEDRCTQLSQHA